MGRKLKTTSMKVDEKIYSKIKELKNHHDLKEKSYQEFVNNALAEKINKIQTDKIIEGIGQDGLFSYVARLDRIEKKIDGMSVRYQGLKQISEEMGEKQKLTDQSHILSGKILEAIKNEDDELYNKLAPKHHKLINKIQSSSNHIDEEMTRFENTHPRSRKAKNKK